MVKGKVLFARAVRAKQLVGQHGVQDSLMENCMITSYARIDCRRLEMSSSYRVRYSRRRMTRCMTNEARLDLPTET